MKNDLSPEQHKAIGELNDWYKQEIKALKQRELEIMKEYEDKKTKLKLHTLTKDISS